MTAGSQSPARRRSTNIYLGVGCALLALCLLCAGAGAGLYFFNQHGTAASQQAVEYVLDASSRMALTADTGTGSRLEVAEGVLAEIVRPANPALTAGLRAFGTGKVADACADTDLLVPLALANQGKISSGLQALNIGSRPEAAMATAVVAALRDLATTKGPRTLVVVTGGSDSCNAQAGQLIAAEAKRDGIDYQLFVIGYLLTTDQGVAVSGLVDTAGNGHYIEAHNRAELIAVLQAVQQYVNQQNGATVASVLATVAALPTSVSTTAPSKTPVARPTRTATASATPTSTATAGPLLTPSPTPNLSPQVVSFVARFDPVRRSTFYSVTVSSETISVSVPAVHYTWSITNKCGVFTAGDAPTAEWHHPDEPGSCPNEPVHPGVITVVISNQYGAIECFYTGGSAPGNFARCQPHRT